MKNNFKYNFFYDAFCILFIFLILLSYLFAFFSNEDSSGGGILDFELHIFNNFLIFLNNDLNSIDWIKYDSSSLPFHYLVSKLFINTEKEYFYRTFWFYVSFLAPLLFFFLIRNLPKLDSLNNYEKILLSCSILLSPYFRTSAVWGLEENIGIILSILTLFYYFKFVQNKTNSNLILLILFSCLTFLCRQNYFFLSLLIFVLIIDKNYLFSKRNLFISFLFLFFLTPSIYFFIKWGSLMPPINLANERYTGVLHFNNIPTILNIIFIYIFPFAVFYIKNNKFNVKFRNISIAIVLYFIYLFIFSNYHWTNNGSGALPKFFNLFINDIKIIQFILVSLSFLSALCIFIICINHKILFLFFIPNILFYLNIHPVFQEYFDPITYIFLIIFGSKQMFFSGKFKIQIILPLYLTTILVGSIIYH